MFLFGASLGLLRLATNNLANTHLEYHSLVRQGGIVLGLTRLLFKGQGIKQITDPIEANALRGGQMSLRDSLRLGISTLTSNASGASVGME